MRLILLNEVAFEYKRLELRLHHNEFEIDNGKNKTTDLWSVICALLEVGPDTAAKVNRLSHVNNMAKRILIEITSGLDGKRVEFFLKSGVGGQHGIMVPRSGALNERVGE